MKLSWNFQRGGEGGSKPFFKKGRLTEIPRGGEGVSKPFLLKYEAKLEFPEGWGRGSN